MGGRGLDCILPLQLRNGPGLPSVFITFSAWSLSEVIRYSHYALSCIGGPPYFITYLRYTAFILLYPIGVWPGESTSAFIKREPLCRDSLLSAIIALLSSASVIPTSMAQTLSALVQATPIKAG
ncbi:hypothetical protein HAX54_019737 [Datura stramonium]|uniref:Very-long-chain (3R)-3-hydroxyacyl-CoA dehydratase n=1 Tax=Datura stramonium TaxID=4076 RepID=A0ABS8US87_DATST|nr:hypothetical protein [Datura stramonium]